MVLSQGVGSCFHCSRVLLPVLPSVQVFVTLVPVTEKTRGYSGVTSWMSLHRGVRSEDLAMAVPIHPVSHTKHPFTELCVFFVPLALAVFFLCLPYTASFRLQPVRSPLGGEEELWMLPTALEPGGLQLLPHFMKGFLLNFRCQIRLENHRNVKVLNVAVPFLLKSSKPVIILKVKCWWRVLKLCQECSPLAP